MIAEGLEDAIAALARAAGVGRARRFGPRQRAPSPRPART